MGFIRPSNDSSFIPAAYAIDGGTPMNPSFPSANGTFKQSLFTATSLDPNTTHTLSITIVNGSDSTPYSLTNFLVYNPPTGTINKDNQDDRQGHGNSNSKSSPAPNTSTIVAAALAAVFFVLLASIIFVLWWRRRQRIRRARNRAPSMHTSRSIVAQTALLHLRRYLLSIFSVHSHRHGVNSSGHTLSIWWFHRHYRCHQCAGLTRSLSSDRTYTCPIHLHTSRLQTELEGRY